MKCPCCGVRMTDRTDIQFTKTDAFYNGKPLGLTPNELQHLKIMWDTDFVGFTTTGWKKKPNTSTATCMHHIRRKLEAVGAPFVVRSVRREGYVLQPKVEGVNA